MDAKPGGIDVLFNAIGVNDIQRTLLLVATRLASDRASAMTGAFANVTCGYWVDV